MDHHGSIECGRIATSCRHCGRFHIDADVNVVDVVDDDDNPAREGEIGWILVTPLYNYGMPLIRYDHADQGRLGAADGCKVTLPVLDEVFGKDRTYFRFPGGITLRPTLSASAVIKLLGAQAYQVAQVASDRCEFRIVPGDRTSTEMKFDEMTRLLRATLWEKLHVDYCIVDTLPRRSPRSKVSLFVYEVPETADGASLDRQRTIGDGRPTAEQPAE
jgi:phenylacetate-CoA ligase